MLIRKSYRWTDFYSLVGSRQFSQNLPKRQAKETSKNLYDSFNTFLTLHAQDWLHGQFASLPPMSLEKTEVTRENSCDVSRLSRLNLGQKRDVSGRAFFMEATNKTNLKGKQACKQLAHSLHFSSSYPALRVVYGEGTGLATRFQNIHIFKETSSPGITKSLLISYRNIDRREEELTLIFSLEGLNQWSCGLQWASPPYWMPEKTKTLFGQILLQGSLLSNSCDYPVWQFPLLWGETLGWLMFLQLSCFLLWVPKFTIAVHWHMTGHSADPGINMMKYQKWGRCRDISLTRANKGWWPVIFFFAGNES